MKDISTLVHTIRLIERRKLFLLFPSYTGKQSFPAENIEIRDAIIAELDIIAKSLNSAIQRIAEARLEADGI